MQTDSRSALIRRLALASLAGQLAWVALTTLGGLLEPGYSEIRHAVSVLGADTAARPWLFNTAAAIWGASFIAAAAALALDAPRGWRGWIGPALIAFTGLAQILDGFPFPADCRPNIDAGCLAREQAGDVSWQHVAHGWTYFVGAVALALSLLAMAWRFHGDARWGRVDLLALAAGLLGLAVVGGLFFATDDGTGAHYGLVQRVALAGGGFWVGSLTIGLLAIHGRGRDPAVRLMEWIRGLPGGQLVVRPGSGLQASSRRR
ncbi:MAG TPA: DUF998 domain-containing protein [Thermoleophilaceae bacterium]|nr:DUF998 domain-containing protein [Thermoleophilaceae bacterium]